MTTATAAPLSTELLEIPLGSLRPHPANREHFAKAAMAELIESLRSEGQLTPAIVRRRGGDLYEILAGERRWRAAPKAGLATLRCEVRECDDAQALRILLRENRDKETPHPLDELRIYEALLALPGADLDAVALETGRERSHIQSRLQLRRLADPVRKAFLADEILLGHALYLARLEEKDQVKILKARLAAGETMTVASLKRWIERDVQCQLQGAPFALDDTQLVPAAGPCTTCPKRTSQAPDLFGAAGKQDRCLDPGCFQGKARAQIERAKAAIAAEAVERGAKPGVKVAEVSPHYGGWGEPKSILRQGQWREVKPNDPDAQPAVLVDGDKVGKPLWISTKPAPKEQRKPERWELENRRRAEKAKAEAKRRRRIQAAVIAQLPATLSLEDLRAVIRGYVDEMHHESRKTLVALHGLEGKQGTHGGWNYQAPIAAHIGKLGEAELNKFLLTLPLMGGHEFGGRKDDPLREAAKRYKVDIAAIDRAIAREAGEKKKAKRAQVRPAKKLAGDVRRAKKKTKARP